MVPVLRVPSNWLLSGSFARTQTTTPCILLLPRVNTIAQRLIRHALSVHKYFRLTIADLPSRNYKTQVGLRNRFAIFSFCDYSALNGILVHCLGAHCDLPSRNYKTQLGLRNRFAIFSFCDYSALNGILVHRIGAHWKRRVVLYCPRPVLSISRFN